MTMGEIEELFLFAYAGRRYRLVLDPRCPPGATFPLRGNRLVVNPGDFETDGVSCYVSIVRNLVELWGQDLTAHFFGQLWELKDDEQG